MPKTSGRTTPCGPKERAGRMRKAQQFFDAALVVAGLHDEAEDVADAYVTLCVHAGVAAADVICCSALGKHAHGENHASAIELLASVDKAAAKHLATLLGMKTFAGYSALPISRAKQKQAQRAVAALLETTIKRG